MKLRLLTLFLFGTIHTFSQSDLLVLKQGNQTIQTWVPGSIINFQFSSKQWIQGIIKTVRNDSIIIEQIIIEQVANQFGFPSIDTAKLGIMKFHIGEIYGMPKKEYAGIIANGALFKLGGGAYILLNVANTLIHKEALFSSINATRLGVASGVFLLGSILGMSHKGYITLGKKYRMEIIHTR
ncbi:MAG: hypothetical protein ABIS69_05970 [Sediminibacterium sp.]